MSITVIENFISEEDCQTISEVFDKLCVKHPHLYGYLSTTGFENSNEADSLSIENPITKSTGVPQNDIASTLLTKYILKLKNEMEASFKQPMSVVNCNYVQMLKGATNGLHADSTELDGTPYHEGEELEFSGLLYFNSSGKDFTGGEIVFPNQEISISPKAGMAIFFKGDIEHQHEVKIIKSGCRKSSVVFMTKLGNTSDRVLFNDERNAMLISQNR